MVFHFRPDATSGGGRGGMGRRGEVEEDMETEGDRGGGREVNIIIHGQYPLMVICLIITDSSDYNHKHLIL